jgi:hypothetical protein
VAAAHAVGRQSTPFVAAVSGAIPRRPERLGA